MKKICEFLKKFTFHRFVAVECSRAVFDCSPDDSFFVKINSNGFADLWTGAVCLFFFTFKKIRAN